MTPFIAARGFTFIWPALLGLLVIPPLLVALYLRLQARNRRAGAVFAALSALQTDHAAPNAKAGRWTRARAGVNRHGPAALLLIGITLLILAAARPQAVIMLPEQVDAVMLAIDTSGSMKATDLKPDRLSAAKTAAKAFVNSQPGRVRVGLVTMAATAAVAQSPTDNRADLAKAIDRLQPQRGTALGSGLVIALSTLMPDGGIDVEKLLSDGMQTPSRTQDWARRAEIAAFKPVPPGSNTAHAIVLLSDGESNTGPDLIEAAKLAAERGVRVYTVGMGTPQGTTVSAEGWSMRVRLDESALRKVADMTLGEYYRSGSANDLKAVYERLGSRIALGKGRTTEITAVFAGLGAALALLGVAMSMLRSGRIV
ncbi:MAG TPA: VWA domain-containing protein [Burkholderiales bacterium]|nr:VWA domain-containing protein [Burkholderiales bacterium]